jgi:hypothetical protein
VSAVERSALAYQQDLSRLGQQVLRLLLRLWAGVDRGAISESWTRQIPEAAAIVVAGQTVAAEFADPYLSRVLASSGARAAVNPDGFAGATPAGQAVESLMYLPAVDAKQRIQAGTSVAGALRQARIPLTMYAQTTVADAGRLAVASGMAARPHAAGYYRMLQTPSCSRCVILAGKFFRYNRGFQRHPKCDCVHIPVQEADDSLAFDARKAIEAGKATGLSKADTRAVVEFGADPAQVVNARRGLTTAGGRMFTTEGTTRTGIAGARILARDLARAQGENVAGRTFRNWSFDRLKAAEYTDLLRKGKTYTRLTGPGRQQSYAYRFARTPRPTPEQILRDATSREDAVRLLTNFGYLL